MPFDNVRATQPGATLEPDSLIICAHCGHISITPDTTTTRLLSEQEYYAFSPEEKADILFAIRALQSLHASRNKKLIIPLYLQ